jgi:hypothetical protein
MTIATATETATETEIGVVIRNTSALGKIIGIGITSALGKMIETGTSAKVNPQTPTFHYVLCMRTPHSHLFTAVQVGSHSRRPT